jgi:hypothetical protein
MRMATTGAIPHTAQHAGKTRKTGITEDLGFAPGLPMIDLHTLLSTCSKLERGPHPELHLLLSGPLAIDPSHIQRLSPNLAFLTASTAEGSEIELIAKVRDGYLAPLDLDLLCTTCTALAWAKVFPEVDTDTGDRLYLHLMGTSCLPGALELPDPAHSAALLQSLKEKQENAASARTEGRTSVAKRWGGASNKEKRNRAAVFVRWLLDTYSLPWLCSGSGVLDVAGGSGQVAWNLTCIRRCPSTIIDPRPALVNAKQRAFLARSAADAAKLRGALFRPVIAVVPSSKVSAGSCEDSLASALRSSALRSTSTAVPDLVPHDTKTHPDTPQHNACPQNSSEGYCNFEDVCQRLSHALPPIAKSFAQAAHAAGVPYIGQASTQIIEGVKQGGEEGARREGLERRLPLPRQLEVLFEDTFPKASHTRELWASCSMVVGMHPDEATEPIVDACLKSGKAFAVVPCCVFPEMNAHRR